MLFSWNLYSNTKIFVGAKGRKSNGNLLYRRFRKIEISSWSREICGGRRMISSYPIFCLALSSSALWKYGSASAFCSIFHLQWVVLINFFCLFTKATKVCHILQQIITIVIARFMKEQKYGSVISTVDQKVTYSIAKRKVFKWSLNHFELSFYT